MRSVRYTLLERRQRWSEPDLTKPVLVLHRRGPNMQCSATWLRAGICGPTSRVLSGLRTAQDLGREPIEVLFIRGNDDVTDPARDILSVECLNPRHSGSDR